jgi:hypothetical protein
MEGFANLIIVFISLIFWVVGFVTFYHLTRFGVGTVPKRLSAIFLIGSLALFTLFITFYQKLDLQKLIS